MIDESVDIKYTQFTDWGSGFQGSIDITNNGDSSVNGWDLEFDLPREINDIWGANIISSDNGDYTIESLDWNSEIRPGQTINIGFIGVGSGVTPQNFDLEETSIDTPTDGGETPTDGGETPTDGGETPTDGGDTITPSTSSLALGEEYQGRATFYNTSGVKGNSGYDVLTGSAAAGITAINTSQWDGSEASGAFLQVSGPKQMAGADPIIVQVADLLPDRGDGLDLSPQSFEQIANPVDGIVDIEYELIGPGDNFRTPYGYTIGQGLVAEGIEGTNPYYAAVRFNNHRYPIESVELIEEDGDQISLNRESDNRFVLGGGYPLNGPQDLLVTDIFGQEVTLDDVNITGGADTEQVTGEQFGLI
ncbi:MAG: expansin EXLX1 family cellulose-binding protein [Pleurocapsa sp. MO_226.B13]|nr:expansin EXLX1 family cellulose-binding protein [Pleurocapsa sp. MO_226.B13]